MSFKYSSDGIKSGFDLLPEGFYILRILTATPGQTKNKDSKITVDYVVEFGPHAGYKIRYHTVTFFGDKSSRVANIALHYLHCIGEPYDGDFEVNPENWVGKLIRAKIADKTFNGKTFPEVKFVTPIESTPNPSGNLEDVPF